MSNDKKNPLELVLDELTQTNAQASNIFIDFSKLLKVNNRRKKERNKVTGSMALLAEDGKYISKAVLRNINSQGLGAEMYTAPVAQGMKVKIELGGEGARFGRLDCVIIWIKDVEGTNGKHKLVGMEFANTSDAFKKELESFIQKISTK